MIAHGTTVRMKVSLFIMKVQRELSQSGLCHCGPNQYSLTFVVRCKAAGVRLEQGVYKGWALESADKPGVTISFVRDPVELRERGWQRS